MQSYLQAVDIPTEIYNEFQRALETGTQNKLNLTNIDINTLIIKKAEANTPVTSIRLVPQSQTSYRHADGQTIEQAESQLVNTRDA